MAFSIIWNYFEFIFVRIFLPFFLYNFSVITIRHKRKKNKKKQEGFCNCLFFTVFCWHKRDTFFDVFIGEIVPFFYGDNGEFCGIFCRGHFLGKKRKSDCEWRNMENVIYNTFISDEKSARK